jgi:MFS family permease
MGIYSSSQFMGAFVGGVVGGAVATHYGEKTIFVVMAAICLLWFVISLGMKALKKSKSFSFATSIECEEEAEKIADKLIVMPGVVEATLVREDAVAYLKLDDKIADIQAIKALLNPH